MSNEIQTPELKPLYVQVKELIVQEIVAGKWRPGEMLPSESKLAARFNVHQGTVRKALDELASQHIVMRQQGKGSFVAAASMRHPPFHFLRVRPKSGATVLPATEFLTCSRAKATVREVQLLALEYPEVVRLVKIRKFDDVPIIVERIALRGDVFPGLETLINELRPETTYPLLEQRYRVLVIRVDERLTATAASAQDAKLLNVAGGTPLLHIDRIAYALDERPVELRSSRCVTSHHEYFAELG